MTKTEKIQYIRERCIEANPSIKHLYEGCEVQKDIFKDGKYITKGVIIRNMTYENGSFVVDIFGDRGELERMPTIFLEIIGRKIGLADILLAIDKNHTGTLETHLFSEKMTMIYYEKPNKLGHVDIGYYDLKQDDLTIQSEECIDFIYGLLHD